MKQSLFKIKMKYIELKKYLNEKDKTHSLGRLLSYYVVVFAIEMSVGLLLMNMFDITINVNLIWLNGLIYTVGIGGKSVAKKYENMISKKLGIKE